LDQWQKLTSAGSTCFAAYLRKLAIETNHIESIFLLSEGVRLLPLAVIRFSSSQLLLRSQRKT
jgi:hypothetical protein